MEVKEWTYEEMSEFTEEVEGAQISPTTGGEVGVIYVPDVEYAKINGVRLHLRILLPFTRNQQEMIRPLRCVHPGFRLDAAGHLRAAPKSRQTRGAGIHHGSRRILSFRVTIHGALHPAARHLANKATVSGIQPLAEGDFSWAGWVTVRGRLGREL